jgi:hypothetical protein
MSDLSSSYYPHRRRWYSSVLYALEALRKRLHLDGLRLSRGVSPLEFVLGLFLPGHAFLASGRARLGVGILIGYPLGIVVFFVALGHAAANFAFGLLIAAHATSIVHLLARWAEWPGRRFRLFCAVGVLGALCMGVYFPLRDQLLEHWLMPLRVEGKVVVVNRRASLRLVQRGDWIAYRVEGRRDRSVSVGAGFGVDELLARPGDHVEITPKFLFVNGRPDLRRPFMPATAEFTLAEKQWFVWPRYAINGRNIAQTGLAAQWLRTGMIDETQYLGRPFRHWFGRRQIVP